ncbi:bifunctional adenosylcobinamide kinase/adenosylcobinamide-phosphate guanylyltransferase [Pseudoruegeria sp. HB172150]|uniref:bifunctional adenosylcobinamide kinase/adenosylcobinamide-phosphate guanylyltransferase n=1 Tax=Pseudoruegeria sp. HB172150 TaxID=2721164 RepID=UPI00155434C4|nr:bifunctional adenosylcobinamide kinase/adenosylcobinamide-phosphate guanylyltransferase [Pseudoruegeria sp. HB172150]
MTYQRILVLGGSRSGKSRFAETLVTYGKAPWIYLASAEAYDDEMKDRIAAHAGRRGAGWSTVEAPRKTAEALAKLPPHATILFDCATLWLSNQMLAGADIEAETDHLLQAIDGYQGTVVTVSNEVGSGIVPENALARRFRDAQGLLNQQLAAQADLVVLVTAGLPLVLKGELPKDLT